MFVLALVKPVAVKKNAANITKLARHTDHMKRNLMNRSRARIQSSVARRRTVTSWRCCWRCNSTRSSGHTTLMPEQPAGRPGPALLHQHLDHYAATAARPVSTWPAIATSAVRICEISIKIE